MKHKVSSTKFRVGDILASSHTVQVIFYIDNQICFVLVLEGHSVIRGLINVFQVNYLKGFGYKKVKFK